MNKTINMMLIALLALGTVMGVLKECFQPKKSNELLVAGHHIDTAPCLSAMNGLFEGAVDSTKVCSCLIPKFYPLLKGDTTKMQKFEEMGFFPLEGATNDSAQQLLADCVASNVVDTAYKLHFTQFFQQSMMEKLRERYASSNAMREINFDPFVRDVFQRLDGKLTIKEYFSGDFTRIPWVRNVLVKCAVRNRRR